MLSLQLIGTPQVRRDTTLLRFQRRRSLALLAFLVLTNRAHPREALATLLASDADPQAARHVVRVALAELREHLGDMLLISRQSVAFAPTQPVQLDLADFQAALASRDLLALQATLERSSAELLDGLSLGQAPEFESWLTLERQRWHDQRLTALQLLLDHYECSGALAEGIAAGRQLLLQAPWCEEAHRQLMRLLARSGQRTAALVQYERCRAQLVRELGVAPVAATTALYERLRAGMPELASNLAAGERPLLGRAQQQEQLIGQLAEGGCRLVTLVGMGGVGKSALARAVAAHFLQPEALADCAPFSDGVYLVDLANQRDSHDAGYGADSGKRRLAAAIATALGLAQATANPVAQLLTALQGSALLLVLDNLDHCLDGLDLLPMLIARAPSVKLLVTSRMRLGIAAETILELGGLAIPADEAELEQSGASRLFLYHARHVLSIRPLAQAERPHVMRICRLVEGLPLALVLAASWLRTLPCAAIADELENELSLLTTTAGNLPARQRDMRTVLAWSWQQLGCANQSVLARLAGFRGGFTLEEARKIAGASRWQIQALRDASVLSEHESGYYVMHELMRRYAAEQRADYPGHMAQHPPQASISQAAGRKRPTALDLSNVHVGVI
jgi:DNA-binding SARP family transcriptional activator/predicted ATPase